MARTDIKKTSCHLMGGERLIRHRVSGLVVVTGRSYCETPMISADKTSPIDSKPMSGREPSNRLPLFFLLFWEI